MDSLGEGAPIMMVDEQADELVYVVIVRHGLQILEPLQNYFVQCV